MKTFTKVALWSTLALGVGLFPGSAQPASADIVLEFLGVSVSPVDPGHFRWTYNAHVGPVSRVNAPGDGIAGPAAPLPGSSNPGDFVTLYDFRGFTGVAGVTGPAAAEWSVLAPLTGPTPGSGADGHFPTQLPPDNGTIENIAFRKIAGAPIFTTPIGAPFATFFADSIFGIEGLGSYVSADHVSDPGNALDNTSQSRTSSVLTTAVPVALPEPGTMLLFGVAAPGVLAFARKRKQAQA